MSEQAPVLLYDGVCALCNGAVKKILRDDKVGTMRFAALDSEYGTQVIERHPELAGVDSFVIVDNPGGPDERTHVRSDAVLRVIDYLGGARRASLIALLVPRPIRDGLYRVVARIRYRVFGRYDTCPLPPPEVRARFLA
ncbi:thiol-disulfide oxidoreductase DCC family protein [Mycobacteroides immunogenum]|uniref:Thiol-disulfide oxidoreductase n=1 Tax=Mycobacteroides immunogenum TaxID=83262 RepID=A0A7V8LLE9_9MYCO|nr:DCC1-like thiol-disulfide oxidoreductase family protein [Mycobacteroides immunogenum]AMT72199.1 thiol-disulfide oxidoreductase [Mycobacteroides immunogenum]ANO05335.1 thiol-disulfide oxidoreductase [Mycobacteroides immunogenum]KIU40295.1 thiol-disulfide oxidoreductase [Mycobacteroides immunogenum]KPG05736.1 thiol-disulfide oxidoreductase [Mycobacteroides immunogenum]KPG12592.1 thiol-disulfide oxidoreductase [Mycobacteroides immunogenum]